MDFHGFPWVLMGFNGFSWGLVRFSWVLMDFHGFSWVLMGYWMYVLCFFLYERVVVQSQLWPQLIYTSFFLIILSFKGLTHNTQYIGTKRGLNGPFHLGRKKEMGVAWENMTDFSTLSSLMSFLFVFASPFSQYRSLTGVNDEKVGKK